MDSAAADLRRSTDDKQADSLDASKEAASPDEDKQSTLRPAICGTISTGVLPITTCGVLGEPIRRFRESCLLGRNCDPRRRFRVGYLVGL